MTPTPVVPAWPHRPVKFRGHGADICDDDGMRWPCPSQQYLDGIVAAASEVCRLGNQPGFDDDEWEAAITALEEVLRGYRV